MIRAGYASTGLRRGYLCSDDDADYANASGMAAFLSAT